MSSADNTIFDDVFRTMLEKMPRLVIPVINEVFHTSYSDDEHIIQYRNEHYIGTDKIISDSFLGIGGKLFHIECQSSPDNTIEIRMIKYDFVIAADNTKKRSSDGIYVIDFPYSCVLYLRHTSNTPDVAQVLVNLPDGQSFTYSVPIIKVQDYSFNEILENRLFMFLPYYIMRYEGQLSEINKDKKVSDMLLCEYEKIRQGLERSLTIDEKSEYYSNMIHLIVRISDYILQRETGIRERIGEIMGGKVLELPSDYIAQGMLKGRAQAAEKLVNKMRQLGYSEEEINILTAEIVSKESLQS